MGFKEQVASDLSVFINPDEHAESITYNGSPIDAVVDYIDAEGGSQKEQAVLYVKESDVVAPAYNDVVVIGSKTWKVASDAAGHILQDSMWQIKMVTGERFKSWT